MNTKKIKITGTGRSINEIHHTNNLTNINVFVSFIIYFILFVLFVPYLLFKFNKYDIIESYMPNVDLVANILSFHGGLFVNNFFLDLYNPTPTTQASFLSQSAVNYLALLGVTFIIARETKLSNSIAYGWSAGFVMLLMTYLLPSQYISDFMSYLYKKTNGELHRYNIKDEKLLDKIYRNAPSLIGGILLTTGIILLEKNVIEYFRDNLHNIAKFFMKIPSKI
jgi:hypothetical protein